jgi:UDP-2,3-diacylglucosamine hydrolase
MTRNPDWLAMMLSKSLAERIAFAQKAREESKARGESLSDEIMDVNQDAVIGILREYGVETLLHGHTHRPAIHKVDLGDREATRIVLGDWYEQGSVVRWDANGPRLESLPRIQGGDIG